MADLMSVCGICNQPEGSDPKSHVCEFNCGACGQYFDEEEADKNNYHAAEFCDAYEEENEVKKIDMYELNELLIAKGYKAKYEMTGGGCGTIHLYHQEEDKFDEIFLAIGPSDYVTGEARMDELNWGSFDTDEDNYGDPIGSSAYFDEELLGMEFTAENVAAAIDDWEI